MRSERMKWLGIAVLALVGVVSALSIATGAPPLPRLEGPTTRDTNPTRNVRRLPRDIVGVAHVAGRYNFTNQDYLNEGADAILAMGSRVIKVWFWDKPTWYKFNTDWPKVNSLVEMAQS